MPESEISARDLNRPEPNVFTLSNGINIRGKCMKSDLERNHKQMTFAEYAPEIFQTQKSGASDPLALLSQYPGLEKEWMENPDLSQKFSDSLKKKNPEIDPSGFSGKMLKVLYQAIEDGTLKPFNLRWGNWGTYVHGKFLTANTSEYRNTGNACTLSDVLEMDVPEKYYLSEYTAQKLLSLKDTTVEDLIPPHTHTHNAVMRTQYATTITRRTYERLRNGVYPMGDKLLRVNGYHKA